jgi:hypothetical protein
MPGILSHAMKVTDLKLDFYIPMQLYPVHGYISPWKNMQETVYAMLENCLLLLPA